MPVTFLSATDYAKELSCSLEAFSEVLQHQSTTGQGGEVLSKTGPFNRVVCNTIWYYLLLKRSSQANFRAEWLLDFERLCIVIK
jgi:hypothetical protein